MKNKISKAVKDTNTLDEVRDALFGVFKYLRENGQNRIGYVSGIITSEGRDKIPQNIVRLNKFSEHLRTKHDFPIFSATDVFDDKLFARLDANGFKNADWEIFWREVLGAKEKFVTDMFMTPKWEKSKGATDEHKIAKFMKIKVYYISVEI